MRSFGLIGYPLGHSFSAAWFADLFRREGIANATYRNYPLASLDELPALMADPALLGFNVTAPYKTAVMDYLDELDPTAAHIGAVNCVVRHAGIWKGYNVDWAGFAESLVPLLDGRRPQAAILGTGGAAAAAGYGLDTLGIDHIFVSRSKRSGNTVTYGELDAAIMERYRLLINATPLGTYPDTEQCPPLPYGLLTPEHMLFDMVYNPPLSAFLRHGREAGARTMNGRRMLEIQALRSWELFLTARPASGDIR